MLKNPKYIYGPSVPLVPSTLNYGEYILSKLKENSGKTALINGCTHEELTYDEIVQEAINLAVSLTRMGVRKGDVIAISSENRREFWSTIIGIICAGGIVTIINIGYTNDELEHVMGITKPKYMFCSPLAYKTHSKIYKTFNFLKKILLFGDERPSNTILYNDLAIPSNDDTNNKYKISENIIYEDFIPVDVEGQTDTIFILYSSGTTGLPKGVMITHLNVLTSSCFNMALALSTMKGLTITPWYHTLGLVGILTLFARGSTTVYLPKFEAELYLKTVEKYEIVQLTMVPAALVELCKTSLKCNTDSVSVVFCGSAPLYEDTANAVRQRFPKVQAILQGYGLTESTFAITLNYNPDKIGSVGMVISHTVIKVVDPDTKEVLGVNRAGEICVKSGMMMKGYIGRDTKEDFDDEGFFRTGDIGYFDDDGYFYIVDRLKELIKYKSYQVPPVEIEAILLRHPAVRDAGVVGVPHPSAGEVPLAFVVLKPGKEAGEKELQRFVAERLSNPKQLRGGIIFINEIPRNQMSKILRRDLRKMANARKSRL